MHANLVLANKHKNITCRAIGVIRGVETTLSSSFVSVLSFVSPALHFTLVWREFIFYRVRLGVGTCLGPTRIYSSRSQCHADLGEGHSSQKLAAAEVEPK